MFAFSTVTRWLIRGASFAAWCMIAPTALAQNETEAASTCNRACLERWLDRYVEALVANDVAQLSLTEDVKFTENGQRILPGDGLWNTATGAGTYALKLSDPAQGVAVLMGTLREADAPVAFVLRLQVDGSLISEIETLVIRDAQVAERIELVGTPRSVWYAAVPEAQRHTRAELVRIANAYFSGIELNDGRGHYPIAADCARLENGMVTAGDPALISPHAPPRSDGTAPGCLAQFESGVFYYVTRIRDRRFVLVDPERGLAFAFGFFENASGDSRIGELADGTPAVSGPEIPWTWQIAEVFKIENGLIGPVESVLHAVPYGMTSGWSRWEDAMSSEPLFDQN